MQDEVWGENKVIGNHSLEMTVKFFSLKHEDLCVKHTFVNKKMFMSKYKEEERFVYLGAKKKVSVHF